MDSGKEIKTLTEHSSDRCCIAVIDDDKIVLGGVHHTIEICDINSNKNDHILGKWTRMPVGFNFTTRCISVIDDDTRVVDMREYASCWKIIRKMRNLLILCISVKS